MAVSFAYKSIEKAQKDKEHIAAAYDVPTSAVIWLGNNKYIVIKDGKEIRI